VNIFRIRIAEKIVFTKRSERAITVGEAQLTRKR
jgi:hypothetical protein